MKSACILIVLAVAMSCLGGCGGPTVYLSPEFPRYQTDHRIVAILPFEVTIDPKKLPKDYSLEMAEEAEKDEGFALQQQLYIRFLKRAEKGEYTVDFQDVDKTKALIAQGGLDYKGIFTRTHEQLCSLLQVDAVISGTVYRERPMSTGLAVGLGVLFGVWGSTNKVNVTMAIHEAEYGDVVWTYEHEASGSVGSSSEKLAEGLMKNVSKKFPYKMPKEG